MSSGWRSLMFRFPNRASLYPNIALPTSDGKPGENPLRIRSSSQCPNSWKDSCLDTPVVPAGEPGRPGVRRVQFEVALDNLPVDDNIRDVRECERVAEVRDGAEEDEVLPVIAEGGGRRRASVVEAEAGVGDGGVPGGARVRDRSQCCRTQGSWVDADEVGPFHFALPYPNVTVNGTAGSTSGSLPR